MKRIAVVLGLVFVMALTSAALADYTSGDDLGVEGMGMGVVISKSATIRSKASYNGKKLATVPGGTEILITAEPEGNGWRRVQYAESRNKQVEGWMREEYVVQNPIILTLRKSNIPAYSAPSHESKLVGSLAKYTQLYVIGMWDEFYIVSIDSKMMPSGESLICSFAETTRTPFFFSLFLYVAESYLLRENLSNFQTKTTSNSLRSLSLIIF